MRVVLRQKLDTGSLCIVYQFLHQLTFTSGLGNKENTLLHLKQSFFGKCIACYDETHKIQVYVVI